MIEFLIFGPLLGSLIAGLLHRSIGENNATIITTSIVVIAALMSWFIFLDILPVENGSEVVFEWIASGALNSQWAIKIDSLVKVMLVVILSVSSLVHLYSLGYMRDDHNWSLGEKYRARFFSYLSFFISSLLIGQYEKDLIAPLEIPFSLSGTCLLYTSPSPRDATLARMPSSS